jgi:hypothetical protein
MDKAPALSRRCFQYGLKFLFFLLESQPKRQNNSANQIKIEIERDERGREGGRERERERVRDERDERDERVMRLMRLLFILLFIQLIGQLALQPIIVSAA